ncbi:MAG: SDR family oxidoreductase [Candidatus Aminicenantes bacterium]|nr:SDR family oxidoreductase [Candidatus Aminicenantes bacterium]NIM78898.1 SDR family oxidoreductase [Candidatus Aminicenantes bacterium]NIN18154.1 SDR family oxidoreductase [Candidatus Aminicenantes bacterium]NIN42053.1 SDR family oxidoreductase [Candidatus Aminicenantes bacterium]NIN84809.1 SDR family oxidoreductase [Candidatus Aminicenantes bacterium]
MINTGLKDKVVIVTGANHGIGAATALAFASEGAKVFINYLRQPPDTYGETKESAEKAANPGRAYYCKMISQSADNVIRKITDSGGDCGAWEADLSEPDNIPELFNLAEKKFGKVDVVVNNAAFDSPDTFIPEKELEKNPFFADEYMMHSLTSDSHDNHFSVNSRGAALIMAEFARRHIEHNSTWGRIINITTDGARCHASNVSYGASKYAIESYTRSAAVELGPYGITVNVISPGAIQTGWITKELEKDLAKSYPLRRIGTPQDIAHAIIFFASRQADWITGQVLYVGGGNRM